MCLPGAFLARGRGSIAGWWRRQARAFFCSRESRSPRRSTRWSSRRFFISPLNGELHPRAWRQLSVEGQTRLLLFLWAGFILLFFSLTFGSRMEYYSYGAWPAIALLLG